MAAEPRVGVVVINWHARDATVVCLQALQGLVYRNWVLVLIDNDCDDFCADEVRALVPGARYLRTDANLGFAGGSNLGMRQALADGADYVWFLNNDAAPEPQALDELIRVAQTDSRIAVVGAKILLGDHQQRLDSVALDVNLRWGRVYLRGHDEVDVGQYDTLTDTAAVSGCAMLVGRAACERLGGFDERYFAYLEDADLCSRARAAGFRVMAAPRARVAHHRAAATSNRQSVASLYYAARNHLLLVERHGSGTALHRRLRRCFVAALNYAYALRSGKGRLARLQAVRRGVQDYHRGITGGSWKEDAAGSRPHR